MTQLSVGGVFLDLYNDEDIQITYAFDSFESYTPQSSYSKTFRVPSTPKNNQFFQTAFEINGYDFDVTQKHSAIIYNDGDLFMRGEIRLVKIYNLGDGNRIDYELIFFSQVRDLFTSIGNKTLQDLKLTELNHELTMVNVKRSWDRYILSGQSLNPLTSIGHVVYPLIDFGNTYDENESVQQVSISQGNGQHITNSGLTTTQRLQPSRFKPMISMSYLVNKIITEAGYNLDVTTQNLFAIYPFYNVFVSAFGNEARIDTPTLSNNCEILSNNQLYTSTNLIKFNTIIYDYNDNFNTTTYRYVAPKTGSYTLQMRFFGDYSFSNSSTNFTLQLRKNGTTTLVQQIFDYPGIFGDTDDIVIFLQDTVNLTAGDYIEGRIVISSSSPGGYTSKGDVFKVTLSPSDVELSPLLEKDYKQIDFLKDIINKFRLTLRINDETNEVIIEPYNEFITLETEFTEIINYEDWTSKLDISKDIEISPIFFDQPATLNYVDKEDKDWLNDQNLIINKEVYGTLIVDAGNDLLKGSKEIKTNFAPTIIKEMNGTNSLSGGSATEGRDFMFIPHIYSLEAGETKLLKKPIVPKTRLMYYNEVLRPTGKNTSTDNPWYYNLDGVGASQTTYPFVSPYSGLKNPTYTGGSTNLTYDLNWQVEDTYLLPENEFYIPNRISVFDYFWSGYINTLYNKWSRRVSAYFMLDPEDLKYFDFKKKIFVKGTYYYVEKIHSVIIGKRGSYKVDLIKLLDPQVPSGGYIPPTEYLVWNTTDVFFDVEETFWNG